jgi:hypothetical protein
MIADRHRPSFINPKKKIKYFQLTLDTPGGALPIFEQDALLFFQFQITLIKTTIGLQLMLRSTF